MIRIVSFLVSFLLTISAMADIVEITVSNPGNFPRENEIVEIDEGAVKCRLASSLFVITDSKGVEVPWQTTYNGKLIFPVSIPAGGKETYTVTEGIPAMISSKVYGRLFNERIDDFAWENDRAAYRAYGPALQKRGERSFGYDVWTKSVSEPILEKRYWGNTYKGIPYHKDHGDGMDVYIGGPTLGGGTSALLDQNGEILYPWCFSNYEILDKGPLRITFRLEYPPMTAEKGNPYSETRIISLDAGDWLNRTEVTYRGLSKPQPVIAGQVIHKQNPEEFILDSDNGITAYADLTENKDAGNGTIFVGTVKVSEAHPTYIPLSEPIGDAIGHAVLEGTANDGEPFVYYWGSGWSKGGMPDMDKWLETLRSKRRQIITPLQITVTPK